MSSIVSSILDALRGKVQAKQADAAAKFRDLARQVAAGKAPNAEVVLDTLRVLGKSLSDLEAAAAVLVRREELKPVAAKLPQARKELAAVEKEALALEAKFARAQEEYNLAMAGLADRERAAQGAVKLAEAAAQELRTTCQCPEVAARRESLRQRRQELARRAHQQGEEAGRLAAAVPMVQAPPAPVLSLRHGPHQAEQEARREQQLQDRAAANAAAERARAEHERTLAELRKLDAEADRIEADAAAA